MDIVRIAIHKPVGVSVAVILVVMFGLIGLNKLPVQLTPDVETPQISVSTVWGGATPYEIEKEIIEKQEELALALYAPRPFGRSNASGYIGSRRHDNLAASLFEPRCRSVC